MTTIFQIRDALRSCITPFVSRVYMSLKPIVEKGECAVIGVMPLGRTNYSSSNDLVIFLYVPKKQNLEDTNRIEAICIGISERITNFMSTKYVINFTESESPQTNNFDEVYTVTTIKVGTISY